MDYFAKMATAIFLIHVLLLNLLGTPHQEVKTIFPSFEPEWIRVCSNEQSSTAKVMLWDFQSEVIKSLQNPPDFLSF